MKNKKNQKYIYIAVAGIAIWYLLKKSKKSNIPGQTNLSSQANQLAQQQVKNIDFVPDMETFKDQYAMDKKNCK